MNDTTPHEKQALRRAAEVVGGQAALAAVLGFNDRRNVWPWFNDPKRRVPAEHCPAIEKATRERGAPVLCEELRPDVAWEVLRLQAGQAQTSGAASA
jgi:DNA-binding transcriptional regulator YdaS (Cro superfamily)